MVAKTKSTPASPAAVAHMPFETDFGLMHLYATERGVVAIVLPAHEPAGVHAWVSRVTRANTIEEDDRPFIRAEKQLREYFAGQRREFDFELDMRGTPFQCQVWQAVAAVPYGQTTSYGDIARRIGKPAAVRAVGAANGANPLPIVVPCHRIVGADGSLTGYGGGLPMKRRLLDLEGIA
jgi:O-6-methylguanine DNA methyltransferase